MFAIKKWWSELPCFNKLWQVQSAFVFALFFTSGASSQSAFGWPVGVVFYPTLDALALNLCYGSEYETREAVLQGGYRNVFITCNETIGSASVFYSYSCGANGRVIRVGDNFNTERETYCNEPRSTDNSTCGVGNPIIPNTGNKYQVETDYSGNRNNALILRRYYNSQNHDTSHTGFGPHWRGYYDRVLVGELREAGTTSSQLNRRSQYILTLNGQRTSIPFYLYEDPLDTITINVYRPDGNVYVFSRNKNISEAPWISQGNTGQLTMLKNTSGEHIGWQYRSKLNETEVYNLNGQLVNLKNPRGLNHTLNYDEEGELVSISDNLGQRLRLTYEEYTPNILGVSLPSQRRLLEMVDPEGGVYTYEYDAQDRLIRVIKPDQTQRQYLYETVDINQYALVGIIDENNHRYVTWVYDDEGRAILSERIDGAGRVALDYSYLDDTNNSRVVATNELGKQTTYHYRVINGIRKITQVEGHPSANCAGANQAYTYDSNGFMASKTDWQGNVTTYIHNDRGQELSRTEASGTPQERTITTEWHSEFNLPVRVVETERETVMTYDTNGRLLSRNVQVRSGL